MRLLLFNLLLDRNSDIPRIHTPNHSDPTPPRAMSPFHRSSHTPSATTASATSAGERVATLRKVVSRTFSSLKLARKAHAKPPVNGQLRSPDVPYLPMELWGIVIKHACLTRHDPLDTAHELSFLEDSSSLLSTYQAAMMDKRACSLVSRQWNAYAKEYLYEFVWISNAVQAKLLAHLLILQSLQNPKVGLSYGSYIRRLHIETPVLELCAPADLRSILENAPSLCIYSDHHSIQRSLYDNRCSSEAILKLVAQPKIRRLSWTCYSDAPLQPSLIPLWTNLAANLEFLELSSCSSNVHTAVLPVVASRAQSSRPRTSSSSTPSDPTSLEYEDDTVHLPSLRALRMSLDDDAFAVLASWSMPALTHLSVLSPDFTRTGPGFAAFFRSHGAKLVQLELGHRPELTEEQYITVPPSARTFLHNHNHNHHNPQTTAAIDNDDGTTNMTIGEKLAMWTPNLREFVCAADAEWHWQSPDWMPRHCLLAAHPNVELIGVRGVDKRLKEDPDLLSGEAYFTLFEQLGSFLADSASSHSSSPSSPSSSTSSSSSLSSTGGNKTAAFPKLRYIRDMSPTSDQMRREQSRERERGERVLQFWMRLVRRCKERGVWLEDCVGVDVSVGSLMRMRDAAVAVGQGERF